MRTYRATPQGRALGAPSVQHGARQGDGYARNQREALRHFRRRPAAALRHASEPQLRREVIGRRNRWSCRLRRGRRGQRPSSRSWPAAVCTSSSPGLTSAHPLTSKEYGAGRQSCARHRWCRVCEDDLRLGYHHNPPARGGGARRSPCTTASGADSRPARPHHRDAHASGRLLHGF